MRRAFRVATAFAGAAACATAFAPAADAAVARPEAATHEAKPDITVENCTSGTKQWMHLYWPASKKHGPTCFGFAGPTLVQSVSWSGVCGGDNYGTISGFTQSGVPELVNVTPGTGIYHFPYKNHILIVTEVSISHWIQGHSCPQ